jgi:hypothetical protein
MRSDAGTKSGEPSVVVRSTKDVIDVRAAPSFQEGSGFCGSLGPAQAAASTISSENKTSHAVLRP